MKKKLIIAFSCFLFVISFAFLVVQPVHAEETQDETTQTEQVETAEEEVTISVKLNEFLNKWLTPAVSGALGLFGSFLMYFLTKKRHAILLNKLTEGVQMTEKARASANLDLEQSKKDYESMKEQLLVQANEYKELLFEMKAELDELKTSNNNLSMFKQLVAYLVSSTPELAKNGYAQKILLLLDEGVKQITNEIVGDDNGTNSKD